MTNRYTGSCKICGTNVAAGAGQTVNRNGGWIVLCAAHAAGAGAAAAALALVVRVWLAAGRVFCAPVGRLSDRFDVYLAATRQAGARYSKADNAQICDVVQGTALIAALRTAGFVADVAPDLAAALQARAAQATAEVAGGSQRATGVDAQLRALGKALFPFQGHGVEWLAPRQKAILGDDMGLGKTIQALIALPVNAPVLVVCPKVAKGVWEAETAKWRSDLTVTVISGRGNFRWPVAGEMVIVNYDVLPGEKAAKKGWAATLPVELQTAPQGVVLIADEAQTLKNSGTSRTSQFRALRDCAFAADGRVWLLTATPIMNRGAELWAMLQALSAGNQVYGSYARFTQLWNCEQTRYGTDWGQPEPEVASLLTNIMLRRMKRDVLTELPAKTVRTVVVNGLSAGLRQSCDAVMKGGNLAKLLADPKSNTLAFETLSKVRAALAEAKYDAAVELVETFEDANEPVVVFSAHRAPILALGKRPGWACITGDTTDIERTAIAARFQAGELKGIAGTIKAIGVSLTLTRSSNGIFIDEEWTPSWNAQAQDRLNRIGQTRGVVITRLVADHPLDRRIAELLADKTAIISAAIDAASVGADVAGPVVNLTVDAAGNAADAEKAIEAEVLVVAAEQMFARAPVVVINPLPDVELDVSSIECPF